MTSVRLQVVFYAAAFLMASCGLATSNAERMQSARSSIEAGDYRGAVVHLRSVLIEDPNHNEARLALANVLIGLNDLPTAEKELQRAIELGAPASELEHTHFALLLSKGEYLDLLAVLGQENLAIPETEVFEFTGEALLGLRNGFAAEENYRSWLAVEPDSGAAKVGLAKSRAIQGAPDEAVKMLESLLGTDPTDSQAWLALGNVHYGLRDYEAAVTAFKQAIATGKPQQDVKRHVFALMGLSDSELMLRDLAAARRSVAELSRYAPGLPETVLQRARTYELEGDYLAASRELLGLLKTSPEDPHIMLMLAVVQWRAGNINQAQEYLQRVVALSPENYRARKLLGQIHLQQRNTALAIEMLEPLLDAQGNDAELFGLLAIADIQRDNTDSAMSRLVTAAQLTSGNSQATVQLAEGYLRTGEPQKALDLLREMPLSTGGSFARERVLITAYIDLDRAEDASAVATDLVTANENDVNALQLAARYYLSVERFVEGRKLLQRCIELAPNNAQSRLMLAKLDLMQHDSTSAAANFQAVFDYDSINLTATLGLAQIALDKGEKGHAIDLLERAFLQHPGAPLPALVLANIYLRDGRNNDAVAVAESLVMSNVSDLTVIRSVGRIFFNAGALAKAQEQFELAVEREPRSSMLLLDLTRSLMSQGKHAQALAASEQAIKVDPTSLPAQVLHVLSLIQLGRLDAAEQHASALVEAHPDDPSVALAHGEALVRQGRYPKAIAAFEEAAGKGAGLNAVVRESQVRIEWGADSSPEQPLLEWIESHKGDFAARKALADVYRQRGRRDLARREYEALLGVMPNDPVVLNNLAVECQVLGDLDQALKHAEAARKASPYSGAIADTLGWIHRERGDYASGVSHLRDARKLMPGNHEITYHLAATLSDAGATAEARDILTELLQSQAPFASRDDAAELLAKL